MREKFTQAHKMTKEIVEKYNVNYRTQFAICLKFVCNVKVEEKNIDENTDTQKKFVDIIAETLEVKLLDSDKLEYEGFYSAKRYTKVNFWNGKRFYISSTVYEKRGANHSVRTRKQDCGYVQIIDGKLDFSKLEPVKLWIGYTDTDEILKISKEKFNKKNSAANTIEK